MWIDGRPAQSGSIVVAPRQEAQIVLPFGNFYLAFNPLASPPAISLTSVGPKQQIVFNGVDNVLGVSTTLDIPLSDGRVAHLTLAVHAIGDGPGAARIVHYTVS